MLHLMTCTGNHGQVRDPSANPRDRETTVARRQGVPYLTTLAAAETFASVVAWREDRIAVRSRSLQDHHS
jgi:ferric-dicitrate binding protein FerR (iron transport regulator)